MWGCDNLERFVIHGGRRLKGEIGVSGAKNAVLPIMAATLMCKEPCILENVPLLNDVFVMIQVLEHCGAVCKWEGNRLYIDPSQAYPGVLPENLIKKMRASNLILGPLLARFGEVSLPFPGGCAIGSRPMDFHLKSLEQLGAVITEKNGFFESTVKKLQGNDICLDFPSVGATENILMAAALSEGETVLQNAAREPEIIDLANFLIAAGAKIKGAGSDVIIIEGVPELSSKKELVYSIMPDRIEAGTFMIAGAITGGDVVVDVDDLIALLAKLKEAGLRIEQYDKNMVRVRPSGRLKAVDIRTMPFPGFATDLQPQFMALMTLSLGTAIISENIFENRFKHADELRRMGANVKIIGRAAVINGVERISGATVEAPDLRAGAALVLAALAAEGNSTVENIAYIDRGYNFIEKKLSILGADIVRSATGKRIRSRV